MRRHRTWIIISGVLLLALLGYALLPSPEPTYEGRTLSEWMEEFKECTNAWEMRSTWPTNAQARREIRRELQQRKFAVTNALFQIGPKATPYLLDWLDYHPPAWEVKLRIYFTDHWGNLGKRIQKFLYRGEVLEGYSSTAFQILGPAAEDAIPGLKKLLKSENFSVVINAAGALADIGPKGLPPLMEAFADTTRERTIRAEISHHMRQCMSSNDFNAFVVKTLQDPDPFIRQIATNRLNPPKVYF